MYSGNLGRVHALDAVLDLATLLATAPDVIFVLVGDGAQSKRLKARVAQESLPNVTFLPPQPQADLGAMLSAADLHLVTLREACAGLVWPSKFYGLLAVGRPALFLGPATAEISREITNHGLGFAGPAEEVQPAADWITGLHSDSSALRRLQNHVLAYHEARRGFARSLARWQVLLDEIDTTARSR